MAFFALNRDWVIRLLADGISYGVVKVAATEANAQYIVATLQGALLLARLQHDPAPIDVSGEAVRAWVTSPAPGRFPVPR